MALGGSDLAGGKVTSALKLPWIESPTLVTSRDIACLDLLLEERIGDGDRGWLREEHSNQHLVRHQEDQEDHPPWRRPSGQSTGRSVFRAFGRSPPGLRCLQVSFPLAPLTLPLLAAPSIPKLDGPRAHAKLLANPAAVKPVAT